jgi:hypothetical protein
LFSSLYKTRGDSRFHRALAADSALPKRWLRRLDEDCNDIAVLSKLMLGYAPYTNQCGPVLISSNRTDHIEAAERNATTELFGDQQMSTMARLVGELSEGPAWSTS